MDTYDLGDFRLRCGITLPGATLAYRVHGTLNAKKDNAILFPSFLGGAPEALEAWIGPGRPLDPDRYYIILPGHFGLPPTTSPSTAVMPFDRGAFPAVHIADDVVAQHRLLTEHLGVEQLALVLGWSVGGLQTYEWAVRYPEMVKRMASIAGAPKPSPWTRMWLRTVIEEPLTADPSWRHGFYHDRADVQAGARLVGHGAALTLTPPAFYREGEEAWRALGFASAEDFVARFWEPFWLAQDPNDVIVQSRKARAADPAGGGDLSAALARITARAAVLAFTGDHMFQPAECRADAARIAGASFHEIDSAFGHLATFSLSAEDVKAVDAVLAELLAVKAV
jgi:homoserine O-acetyltransferase/O-succinyltransferase